MKNNKLVLLHVDDEADLRSIITAMLGDSYEVISVCDAIEALDIINSGVKIDAVLTDEAMPVVSGIAMIKEIRKSLPTLPILIISGFVTPSLEVEAKHLGASCLAKPFFKQDLIDAVNEIMSV